MINITAHSQHSDQKLLIKIKENSDNLVVIYRSCKPICLRFMKGMTNNIVKDDDLEDIFHDAIIALYEKIVKGGFILTASIQTYLNSVCRNLLFNKYNKSRFNIDFFDKVASNEINSSYCSDITDELEEIEVYNETLFQATELALETIRNKGGNCYELLTQFWYHKKTMDELTRIFEYTNVANTKNQKAKCQKRLSKLAFDELQKINE